MNSYFTQRNKLKNNIQIFYFPNNFKKYKKSKLHNYNCIRAKAFTDYFIILQIDAGNSNFSYSSYCYKVIVHF